MTLFSEEYHLLCLRVSRKNLLNSAKARCKEPMLESLPENRRLLMVFSVRRGRSNHAPKNPHSTPSPVRNQVLTPETLSLLPFAHYRRCNFNSRHCIAPFPSPLPTPLLHPPSPSPTTARLCVRTASPLRPPYPLRANSFDYISTPTWTSSASSPPTLKIPLPSSPRARLPRSRLGMGRETQHSLPPSLPNGCHLFA